MADDPEATDANEAALARALRKADLAHARKSVAEAERAVAMAERKLAEARKALARLEAAP